MRYQDFIKPIPGEVRDTQGNYDNLIDLLGYAGAPVTPINNGYHEIGESVIRAKGANYDLRDILRNIATLDKALDTVTATHASTVSITNAVVDTPLKVKAESVITQASGQTFAVPKAITGNASVTVTDTIVATPYTYTLTPSATLWGLAAAPDNIQFNTGLVTRQTKQVILNGTSEGTWTAGAEGVAPYVLTLADKALGTTNFACSHSVPAASGTTAETCVGSAAAKTITFYPNVAAAYNTLTKWKALLLAASTGDAPVQLVYEIADTTEQLLPTYIPVKAGTNVITHNAEGAVTVEYYRTTASIAALVDAPGSLPIADTNNVYAVDTIDGALDQLGASAPGTWAAFLNAVRNGTIDQFYAVGDQFNVAKGATNLVFDLVDIGSAERNITANGNAPVDADYFTNFPDAKPVTLLMHDQIYGIIFDAPEANYKITTQIDSGATRNITFGVTAYNFTASKNLVVGGKLRFIDATHFGYYPTSSATVESMAMAAGAADETYLDVSASLSTQNHADRVLYGSNKYTESAVKQWLNAAGAAGSFWTSKSDYDLAPSWHSTLAGFQNGLDANFLAAIGQTTRQVELNTVTDGGGDADITDKIFLPSRKEIFGAAENVTNDGIQFQGYVDSVDADRIKYDTTALSTARLWWMRSPYAGYANLARNVTTSGALSSGNYASGGLGAAAACVIL